MSNPLNMPGYFGSEDIEKMNKDRAQTFKKDRETAELFKKMQEDPKKFREMFGQEMIDQLREVASVERSLSPIKAKITLQAKLKHDYPMCEKCVNWNGVDLDDEPCPYDNDSVEKEITFETNEISQNPFPVEVCRHFSWKKDE